MRCQRTRRAGQTGFTLVEMLVVMSLLAVIMVAMASSLRTIGQVEERVDARLGRSDEFRTTVGFLREVLGRVSMRKFDSPVAPGFPYLFKAEANAMSWVGVMPARYGAGGRYFFHLGLEATRTGTALVLRYFPWNGGGAFPDWSTGESRILLDGVTSVSIRYFDTRSLAGGWSSDWSGKDVIPDRVSLGVVTSTGEWPELIVPMRGISVGGSGGGGVSFGGAGEDE